MAIIWAFDTLRPEEVETLIARERDTRRDEERRLLCAACGRTVARPHHRISVGGAHRHTFTNPLGLVFTIGCFSDAPGCVATGEATAEWSWFRGYRWQVGLCRGCGVHLGWGYRPEEDGAATSAFYGLILERLASPSGKL